MILTAAAIASSPIMGGAAPNRATAGFVGAVDTLAGPGFCDGPTLADRSSLNVGSMAVGGEGSLYFDTGLRDQGIIAVVTQHTGQLSTFRSEPAGIDPTEAPPGGPGEGPSASRLAVSGGSLLVATARAIYRLPNSIVPLLGIPDGDPGSAGDGGPAEKARFNRLLSIASDVAGNLYLADEIDRGTSTFRIRFVNRGRAPVTFYEGTPQTLTVMPGDIDTLAGVAGEATTSDGVAARTAVLTGIPPAMAVSKDVLYLALTQPGSPAQRTSSIGAVNLTANPVEAHGAVLAPGLVHTLAGGREPGFSGDGGPAREAGLGYVPGIAADDSGLYLADTPHHRIRKIDSRGFITTVIGTGGVEPSDGGFNGNGRPGTETRLNNPYDVKVGPLGVYVADRGNGQVRYLDHANSMRALLGAGLGLTWHCAAPTGNSLDASGNRVEPGRPISVAADPQGNVYFVGAALADLKRVSIDDVVARVAGVPVPKPCRPFPEPCPVADGPADSALFDHPTSIAAGNGGIFLYDAGHLRVRFLNLSSKRVTVHGVTVALGNVGTVVGTGLAGDALGDGPALSTELSPEGSVAVDGIGGLWVADVGNKRVLHIDARGQTRVVASAGSEIGCCDQPMAVAADQHGNAYVADGASSRIWFLNIGQTNTVANGQVVPAMQARPVAGNGTVGVGGLGGPALESALLSPLALAVDAAGNLYISDDQDSAVLRVDPAGNIDTVVGTGNPTFTGDGLPGQLTAVNRPAGVAVDQCGNLLIADKDNDRVRRLNLGAPCVEQPAPQAGRRWQWVLVGVTILLAIPVGLGALRRHGRSVRARATREGGELSS